MKEISVFDVIGPNMIGPSSSHTAGALRIALLASKLVRRPVQAVDFTLYGSFAKTYQGHGTDRALVAGILGFGTDDARIRDSFRYAGERGLKFTFALDELDREVHPNTVDLMLTDEAGAVTTVRGVSTGGGSCTIQRINGVEVSLSGDYATLLIRQKDAPGVVAYITSVLSGLGINIAYMRLYRESRGQTAYTIIEVDGDIPTEAEEKIEEHRAIESALLIRI